jgi:hypothetical protein
MKAALKLLGAPTIGVGGCPGRGCWWSELKEANPQPAKNHKPAPKMGGFPHCLTYKSLKTKFFAQKYFIRYCIRRDGRCCWCRLCQYVTWSVVCLGVGETARGEQLIAYQGQEGMGIRTTSKRSRISKKEVKRKVGLYKKEQAEVRLRSKGWVGKESSCVYIYLCKCMYVVICYLRITLLCV